MRTGAWVWPVIGVRHSICISFTRCRKSHDISLYSQLSEHRSIREITLVISFALVFVLRGVLYEVPGPACAQIFGCTPTLRIGCVPITANQETKLCAWLL